MACFLANKHHTKVTIPEVESVENGITSYSIQVDVAGVSWRVSHRYKDFDELHEKLVTDHSVAKDMLPPKKVIGNRDPVFVEKRRAGLEVYLGTVLSFLQQTMPRELATFLDFHRYDILFILQEMALHFFEEGEQVMATSKHYSFSPLQLHAISERLKQPCPPSEMIDKKYDFSHVLDFCQLLPDVTVQGSSSPIGSSNIIPNELLFEMSSFKTIQVLKLCYLPVCNIYNATVLRENLISLNVHHCRLERISHILLCDDIHKDSSSTSVLQIWKKLTAVDFSNNEISEIDQTVKLMPNLERLNLNFNKLSNVENLTSLPHLSQLHLSGNCFSSADNLHTKMGNIVYLDLSQNAITSLEGFSKLYSLEGLDLGSNQVLDINEVKYICGLPCLENLVLTGNPVAIVVDYRVKTLEQFGKRAQFICLDNEKSTQKELDTVAVLQALRIVKEGRTPNLSSSAMM